MSDESRPAHIMSPPLSEAEEIPVDRSEFGPGSFVVGVEFDSDEMQRLKAGGPYGPEGLSRFIKRAALELADRQAAEKSGAEDEARLRESA